MRFFHYKLLPLAKVEYQYQDALKHFETILRNDNYFVPSFSTQNKICTRKIYLLHRKKVFEKTIQSGFKCRTSRQ